MKSKYRYYATFKDCHVLSGSVLSFEAKDKGEATKLLRDQCDDNYKGLYLEGSWIQKYITSNSLKVIMCGERTIDIELFQINERINSLYISNKTDIKYSNDTYSSVRPHHLNVSWPNTNTFTKYEFWERAECLIFLDGIKCGLKFNLGSLLSRGKD